VTPIRPWIVLLAAVTVSAADTGLDGLLKNVETRYNRAKTLEVLFTEDYTPPGRPRRTERGILKLRKPGRMRWDYSEPKGKLFLSDGKDLWLYTPAENRAERMKLQESEDMRAPLAFLLGKLNFRKEFSAIQSRQEAGGTLITAKPKTDNLPYSDVEFLVTPQGEIRRVKVTAFDKSVLDFTFDQEKLDPPLDSRLFRFQPPPGASIESEQ
jgi:outer membrane lipoprotein carrier protein